MLQFVAGGVLVKITSDIVFHILLKMYGIRVLKYNDKMGGDNGSITVDELKGIERGIQYVASSVPIKTVRLLRNKKLEAGHIYLLDDMDLLLKTDFSQDCVLLFCGEADILPLKSDKIFYLEKPMDKYLLMEKIGDIIQTLQEWDCELLKALGVSKPIPTLLRIGQNVIDRPFLLLSRTLSVVAHTTELQDVFNSNRPGAEQGLFFEIDDLVVDEVFHSDFQQEGMFYYPDYQCDGRFICYNIYSGEQYLARLISPLRSGELELHPGEEQLYRHFCGYVKELYLRYADDRYVRHQEDRLHQTLRSLFAEINDQPVQKTTNILKDYGWDRHHDYLVAKLRFKDGAEWESTAQYLCSQLENEWQHSCALRVDAHILWIVNLSRSRVQRDTRPFFQSLAYIVREYVCQAGVSNISRDLYMAPLLALQAERALEVGEKRDPHYWYYRFDYYVLDYISEQITSEFSEEQLCSKPLLRLMEHDRNNGTEYVMTLFEYIHSRYNTSLAAKRLFVHRTTFIRRLERIKEISDIDPEDTDKLLHLLLSFRLLGIQRDSHKSLI
jgi:hypothetical protein